MAVSVHPLSVNTDTVSRYMNPYTHWQSHTADIGEHTHTPCGYINTVPINLIHMLSDNLNTSVINKYTNMLGDDSHTVAIW